MSFRKLFYLCLRLKVFRNQGVQFSHYFFDRLQIAFKAIAVLMVVAAVLQLSLISKRGWDSFFGRVDRLQKRALNPARSLMGAVNSAMGKPFKRSASMPVVPSAGWAKRISADQSEGTSPAAREMFVIADDAHLKDD
jgi:hypothetical protein